MQCITVNEAVRKIQNNSSIVVSAFVGCSVPEYLLEAIETSFLEKGAPNNLTVIWDATTGNGAGLGVDHLGHVGLTKKVICSHINFHERLRNMVDNNEIEAHILPYGAMSQLYREIGAGRLGFISPIGLHTYVDPRIEGARGNDMTTESLVELIHIHGQEYLLYNAFPMDVAIIRGTTIDEKGNLTCERETFIGDILVTARAVKHNGGIVIAEVERVAAHGSLNPRDVVVPGFLVDYAVVAPPEKREQVQQLRSYSGAWAHEYRVPIDDAVCMPLDQRKIIARRAAMELESHALVNLGIGVPTGISSVAAEEGIADEMIMTVECGHVGGIPAGGLAFGACVNPDYVVDSCRQFEWYDGGGLDIAYLGAAEIDEEGNANVSKFSHTVGPGGFINIAHTARKMVFCGTLTAGGLKLETGDGTLRIVQEGRTKKYLPKVKQITFSGKLANEKGQEVIYITERAVFRLIDGHVVLTEIAPGIDLQKDVLEQIAFPVKVSEQLHLMDKRIFRNEKMNLTL